MGSNKLFGREEFLDVASADAVLARGRMGTALDIGGNKERSCALRPSIEGTAR
ncbi:hypothetical protein [Pseudarthrobacter sp. PS3-L1]|uniref:hypothetical protein n=1 Tax=Pseudarthrobacter sp. PS3-L1 TaxID=3046207 RepID=UPI0024B88D14|nr:hypothetical protein [Pseudarthrobacter sp. PS3-L1]MDJ0320129.1 hypothetical protein [Pseudarthrobacter sp. PS3-L1]